ncbi:branched-chain amino acid ABC transporter permease [Gloeocapsa sp. PCC 73106]|uniref:branched-chain amino acid ABC transporter permease n=1 Tax=Gloeocapsa sp. PCC 73106 TaxID=102232 RepID=UPI0002AC8BFD|nr:branched-chain amino acid ABC transporter permease [Gloeocapsa sp. PCC 73106]ELR98254.1 branched-chain amino acid ABC-type transport system, permease component [Gloeocapsa sp. PCC 73106]
MDIPQLIFNGISVGSILAIAAIGLTLTYGILKLSNFAHGDFMTLGAYFTWLANTQGVNLGLAIIIGAFGTIIIMLISEQLLWKPMRDRRATPTSLIIISIGLALFLRSGILLIWGSDNQSYDLPVIQKVNILGLAVSYYILERLIVISLAVLAILALHLVLKKTKIGKAMRAVADNVDLARVSGINVERIVIYTWVITGILTAVSGSMYGLLYGIRPNLGWFLILPLFASVILGGIGNPYGAIAGALVIGVAQELTVPWLGSEYKLAVAIVIMIIILLIRPQGLFKGLVQ